ncbi:conserved hypothetical protein [Altererythrobacter sp. B11]|uniref:lysoplasmalogenase family protein n=1 Tax=Altererythrobacter sp. B11 TaxID=2060312 RepID=UPI000DC71075|nr:lysoplasmalogenase family protein [Altererythrobacter sp. B11]BBC73067.1 conserved hypothetical protein [Altererythrobacter sp. B11]
MPKRALAQKRPFLLASIAAALAFYYLRAGPWPELYLIPLKGTAVGLLALYALLRHDSQDAKLLAVMMAIAAIGDMVMEIYVEAGAIVFFGYHLVALMLYLRHKREVLGTREKLTVVALLVLPSLIAYFLTVEDAARSEAALYALAMGGMASAAWASSFPRYRVGAGAILFVIADLLILAGYGPLQGSSVPQILSWPIYYLGQLLIVIGVAQTLHKRNPRLKLVSRRD